MNGLLVVDKPAGMTSHDVVDVVRRATGERSVGHLGTLDPMATGVLPLLLGKYTRLAQFFAASDKSYAGTIRFGFATDTFDAEGTPVAQPAPLNVSLPELRALAARFHGEMLQTPPVFSAKKIGGVPAHKLARAGKPVEVKPARIVIHRFELLSLDGPSPVESRRSSTCRYPPADMCGRWRTSWASWRNAERTWPRYAALRQARSRWRRRSPLDELKVARRQRPRRSSGAARTRAPCCRRCLPSPWTSNRWPAAQRDAGQPAGVLHCRAGQGVYRPGGAARHRPAHRGHPDAAHRRPRLISLARSGPKGIGGWTGPMASAVIRVRRLEDPRRLPR